MREIQDGRWTRANVSNIAYMQIGSNHQRDERPESKIENITEYALILFNYFLLDYKAVYR